MSTASEKGVTVLTVTIALATLVLVLSPSGPIGSRIAGWRASRAAAQAVGASWATMDSLAQRLNGRTGRISIFEFSDYECPYCRANHASIEEWAAKHPDHEMGLLHMPLSIHPAAEGAARAALCAGEAAKGPEMHQLLMTSESWRSDTNWSALARSVEVSDLPRFEACLHSGRITDRLARTAALAASLGITGTPSFVSASGRAVGQQSVEQLEGLQ